MRISRAEIGRIIREELELIFIDDPVHSDSWHPSDVTPKSDAWSGGDNIESPRDHAEYETGESNSGPSSMIDLNFGTEDEDTDLWTCDPDVLFLLESEPEKTTAPEREEIVQRIKQKMDSCGITGLDEDEKGLLDQVNDADEFEDLIRHIFNQTGFDNTQLAVVAKAVAESFIEDPENAENISVYNF